MNKKYGNFELRKLYHISGCNAPPDLVIEITELDNGCFSAKANYKIFSHNQIAPYKHDGCDKDELSAVYSVLNGFDTVLIGANTNEICWVPVDNPNNICRLGTGKKVTLDEFKSLKKSSCP